MGNELSTDDLSKEQLDVLRERWVHYRTEALQIVQNRIRTVQITITVLAAIVGASVASGKPEISITSWPLTVTSMWMFSRQRIFLNELSGYLYQLEGILDRKLRMPLEGWEAYFRNLSTRITHEPMLTTIFLAGAGATGFGISALKGLPFWIVALLAAGSLLWVYVYALKKRPKQSVFG